MNIVTVTHKLLVQTLIREFLPSAHNKMCNPFATSTFNLSLYQACNRHKFSVTQHRKKTTYKAITNNSVKCLLLYNQKSLIYKTKGLEDF